MASTIQVRVDDELKLKADRLFKELGTDTTSAIRMFLTQAISNEGFPFEIRKTHTYTNPYQSMSENRIYEELEHARLNADNGNCRVAEDVISEMRSKYDL